MSALSEFIARQIKKQADTSVKEGQAKYKAYFVNTRLYAAYREEVDRQLKEDGYGKAIVKE